MSRVIIFLTALVLCWSSVARAADDCEFCKKDHKKICADECPKGKESGKPEGCMKKCFSTKCGAVCVKKADPNKTPKAKKADGEKKPKPAKKEGGGTKKAN